MVMLVGLVLMALGLSLAVVWSLEFWFVLRGLLTLGLLFSGFIALMVGFSERKARRDYEEATREDVATKTDETSQNANQST